MTQQTEIDFGFDQAVRTMGLTPEKLRRLIDEGVIASRSDGLDTRISRSAVLAYMNGIANMGKKKEKASDKEKAPEKETAAEKEPPSEPAATF